MLVGLVPSGLVGLGASRLVGLTALVGLVPSGLVGLPVLAGVAVLASVLSSEAQVPPTLGAGSRVEVTRADGGTFTAVVAPKPADPLWQFVDAGGSPINFRLGQLVSVRLTGQQRRVTPRWTGVERAFAWAEVRTSDGQTLDLGIHKWPAFVLLREDGASIDATPTWLGGLAAIRVARGPMTLPGLSSGVRVRVSRADGSSYDGTLSTAAGPVVYGLLDFATQETWRVPLSELHRFRKTGERRGIYDLVEVTLADSQTLTLGVSSWAAWDVVRDDTGRREVNSQSHAGFSAIEALGGGAERAAAPGARVSEAALAGLHAEAAARYLEYRKSGDGQVLGEAGALAEALVDADPGRAGSWVLMGLLYRELSAAPVTLALAEDAFRTATRLDPRDAQARIALGLVLFDQGLYVPALDEFEAVLRADRSRGEPGVIARMNEAYLRDGQAPRGVKFWREWLTAAPGAVAARFALAILLNAQGESAPARTEVAAAIGRPESTPADKAFAGVLLRSWTVLGGRR